MMGRAINGILSYPTPSDYQELTSVSQGEDLSIVFTLSSTVTPSSWVNVEFTVIPEGQGQTGRSTFSITAGSVSITNVAGSGPYVATVTVTVSHVTSLGWGQGSAVWQCFWVDSGNVSRLGSGELPVEIPLVPVP